jgi:hypothetical protein
MTRAKWVEPVAGAVVAVTASFHPFHAGEAAAVPSVVVGMSTVWLMVDAAGPLTPSRSRCWFRLS